VIKKLMWIWVFKSQITLSMTMMTRMTWKMISRMWMRVIVIIL